MQNIDMTEPDVSDVLGSVQNNLNERYVEKLKIDIEVV